jgi:hypothetical protein
LADHVPLPCAIVKTKENLEHLFSSLLYTVN